MTPINKLDKTQTILVIDPSAAHMAYCIAEINLEEKNMHVWTIGMLWTPGTWEKGKRFTYMLKSLETILNEAPIKTAIYTEAFFSNPKAMMGSAVIPTVNGIIELCAYKESTGLVKIAYSEVSPSSWRSTLQIKPDMTVDTKGKRKRDYKNPTKRTVESLFKFKMPDEIKSNLNDKTRIIPYDITDCLAITLSIAKEHGISSFTIDDRSFYNFSLHEKFKRIANEI